MSSSLLSTITGNNTSGHVTDTTFGHVRNTTSGYVQNTASGHVPNYNNVSLKRLEAIRDEVYFHDY